MLFSKEERMDIGRRICTREITYRDAMEMYHISESCAHKYMTDYKKANNIPLCNTAGKDRSPLPSLQTSRTNPNPDIEAYMAMSKEELIRELVISKANELRAKKGYEVKGVGANKEFIPLNRPNSKS